MNAERPRAITPGAVNIDAHQSIRRFDSLTEASLSGVLLALVRNLDLFSLADLLGPYPVASEGSGLWCPACQAPPARVLQGPRATSPDGVIWRCGICRATGTVFAVLRDVLESPAALERLIELTWGDQQVTA